MIPNTTFLRSKKLWMIVVLSIVSLVILEPGRYSHLPISADEYRIETTGVGDSNQGKFNAVEDQSRFDIEPGIFDPTVANFTFLVSKSVEFKIGVSKWAKHDEAGAAEVLFGLRQNQLMLLNDAFFTTETPQTIVLAIDSGDIISVAVDKGEKRIEDLGYVQFREDRPMDVPWIVLSVLLFWIVTVYFVSEAFWLSLIPTLIGSVIVFGGLQTNAGFASASTFVWSIGFFVLSTSILSLIYLIRNPWIQLLVKLNFVALSITGCALPFAALLYHEKFGKPLETTDYFGFFQTDIAEGIAYLRFAEPSLWLIVLLFLPLLFMPILLIHSSRKQHLKIRASSSILIIIMMWLLPTPTLVDHALSSYNTYSNEVDLFRKSLRAFDEYQNQLEVSKKNEKEVYFIVIGEAQSKYHMSQYGYVRPTTPRLDSLVLLENTVLFNHSVATNTHTAMALSQAFTQANHVNQLDFEKCPSIINILNAAGVETHWISNQLKYGIWDNAVSAIASQCKDELFINNNIGETNETSDYDGALLFEIKRKLKDVKEGTHVFFIHLMGNHGRYNERYPKEFGTFDHDNFRSLFGGLNEYAVNQYDNSIIYNDYVISKIVNLLDSFPLSDKALFYFADHAEDLITKHGHSSSLFAYQMIHIPTYFWFSKGFMNSYPQRVENLKNNRDKTFTNDLVYDAIIGLTGIKTKASNGDVFDVFSESFHISDSSIKIIGQIDYASDDHVMYQEQRNIKALQKDTLLPFQVVPHRVNTRGMLHEAVTKGFRGIECDIVFNDTVFEIGHGGDEYMSGNTLEDYLSQKPSDSLDFIWLDLKNLSSENAAAILERLLWLDEQFEIKNRVLVESSIKSPIFSEFAKNGFSTSYYLPTEIAEIKNEAKLKSMAQEIALQVKRQAVKSISFDASLYPWVSNYLAPLIDESIAWRTWQLDVEFDSPKFIDQIHTLPYSKDQRIKTLLVRLHSAFYL